jgi:hypothetical protein
MKKTISLAVFIVLATFNFSAMKAPDSPTKTIINKMMAAIKSHTGSQYTMRGSERLVGKKDIRVADIFTKVKVSPNSVYLKMITDPNKGTELLYRKGENSDKVTVNAGKFIPTVKLNPLSNMLTKDQHHTLLSSGFNIVSKIVGDGVKRSEAEGKFDEVFKYAGDVTWNNKSCYKIVIEDPTWGYTNYTAQKGENIYSIALKLLVPEYCIMELNGLKNFEQDLGGKTLKIFTSFAKKTVLYIDKSNHFPVYQEMQDDKGVFEKYEYFDLKVSPAFKADEFTEKFSDYNF